MNIERLHDCYELDNETGVLTWKVSHGLVKAGDVAGYDSGYGYLVVSFEDRLTRVHRIVFAMVHGYLPEHVDHINGIRSDNRPANLRAATPAQNSFNRKINSNNSSGVKGVSWEAQKGKWRARCEANGRQHYLGLHDDLEAAAEAVRAFRERLHGEFARHA